MFKMQYDKFRILSGESAVDMQTDEKLKSKLQKVMSEYPPLNQCKADKMKNVGRKLSNKRLSVIFCYCA